jgi:carbamoyltransferase
MPLWLKTKLYLPREIRKSLGGKYKKRIAFTGHHESHAASCFFPSRYEDAAILTLDGVGEWDTATIGHGRGNRIEILKTLHFPHSLGLLYSAFTYFTGFKVNSGEYKLMGLAPYGEPKYAGIILDKLMDLKEDGSLAMNMEYFNYCQGLTMTSPAFDQLFDGPARKSESAITQREMDLAASIQIVTEEVVFRMARTAKQLTGSKNLCLAGGVALNCVANGKLLRKGIFDDVFITPAAGDAGGALGAALFVHHQLLGHQRSLNGGDTLKGSLLGPKFGNEDIRRFLDEQRVSHTFYPDEEKLLQTVAEGMAGGHVVGWFHGRMEFGPRALGGRSIIGDAQSPKMQEVMNLKIKFRESFRPFANDRRIGKNKDVFQFFYRHVQADAISRSETPDQSCFSFLCVRLPLVFQRQKEGKRSRIMIDNVGDVVNAQFLRQRWPAFGIRSIKVDADVPIVLCGFMNERHVIFEAFAFDKQLSMICQETEHFASLNLLSEFDL